MSYFADMESQKMSSPMQGYNFFLTPEANAKLMQIQQQDALANALLGQGITPIQTQGRQIGGVGYSISPLEGLAKLADVVAGRVGQANELREYQNLFAPQATEAQNDQALQQQSTSPGAQQGPTQAAANQAQMNASSQNPALSPIGQQIAGLPMGSLILQDQMSNPYAAASLMRTFYGPTNEQKNFGQYMPQYVQNELGRGYIEAHPGAKAYQTAAGNTAASLLTPAQAGAMMNGGPNLGAPQRASVPMPPSAQNMPVTSQTNPANAITATGQIPPVNASQLGMPAGTSPGNAPIPGANPNLTPAQNKAGLAAWQTGQAEKAKNLAETQKTLAIMQSQLAPALSRFDQMRNLAKNASWGLMAETGAGNLLANSWLGKQIEPQTATANARLNQFAAQGVLPELGPMLAQAGIRGNKFLETLANSASGLDLDERPDVKVNLINGLQQQYIRNLAATNKQVSSLGGQPANLAALGIFYGPDDPGFAKLPKGTKFFDAASGKQMVKN